MLQIWTDCIEHLREEIPQADIHTWLAPLHPVRRDHTLKLLAPNRYVRDYVRKNFLVPIQNAFTGMDNGINLVRVEIGTHGVDAGNGAAVNGNGNAATNVHSSTPINGSANHSNGASPYAVGTIHPDHTFEKHVEGSSNQVARAAALQVGQNSGQSYNPLFIYGGVGLGKTHLMHAAGHLMRESNPSASVLYVRSEIFVNDMVKALKSNRMHDFKRHYRSPAALLIDDIQFFARKTQSQEEFFHTFNTLLEGQRQIIITSDRIPNAITDVDTRLISRFSYGLTVAIDPPELETRVAILERKALEQGVTLPNDVAFFVAGAIRSNVRALAGALHRILANARFTGRPIDVALAREALRDLLAHQERQLSVENIQQTVADYYNLRVADLLSKKRARHIARPRQLAMYLAKEYTKLSLPQIGDRFGGRDHTTVLHACRRITELLQSDPKVREDCRSLQRVVGV